MNSILLVIFLLVSTLYLPLNRRPSRYCWKSRLDAHIPLIPVFVFPYILFFPFIAAAIFLLWGTPYEASLLIALIAANALAILFWYLFPNGVLRPEILPHTWLHKTLGMIYRHDGDTNGFPSSHVFVSLICGYFLAVAYPAYVVLTWGSAGFITLSTLFTKQHYVIDLVGGIIMVVPAVSIVYFTGFPVFG